MRYLDEIRAGDTGTLSQFPSGEGWTKPGTVRRVDEKAGKCIVDCADGTYTCGPEFFQVDGEDV